MNLIPKRLFVLTLIGSLLIVGTFANITFAQDTPVPPAPGGQTTALPATKPVIHGALNGSPLESIPGSFCWPNTDNSPLCDVVDDPQPPSGVNVANGDSVVFTLDPAAPAPQTFNATLLDDKNADGEATQIDLSTTGGILTPNGLPSGAHRVEITAAYAGDVQGNQPFVIDVFLLNISGGAAAPAVVGTAPAPEGTTSAPQNVEGAAPTAAATVVTTNAGDQATPVPPTVAPATEAVQATEVVQATQAPQPTEVPPTVGPDTPVPPTATIVAPVIDTSGIPGITVYPVKAIVAGRSYDPIAVNICVTGSQGETVCVNRPTNTTVQRILAVPGSVAQISFQGPRPTAITVSQYSSDGSTLIGKQSLLPDNLVLYTLPPNVGTFVLNVEIAYPNGKANYFFRFNIG